ncbi:MULTISPECIES: PAS-domain containing protein [unclassified Roseovarius]|uniref:PAS-domain containing protein n=1 Tax=unclassified Roseovarius TaxID=2614913 RepID=UPI00273FCCDB|nr:MULTISPECIES: PAS-domain containing protein [unclassified Roseovarius]
MDGNTVFNLAGIFAISVIGSLVVLWIFGAVLGSGRRSKGTLASQAVTENTILFRNGVIDGHDLNALSALGTVEDWNDLRAWLSDRFADLPEYLPDDQTQTSTYHTHDRINDEATVTIAASKGMTCVTLVDPIECQPVDRHQAMRLKTAQAEDHLALMTAPCAIWKTNTEGVVTWRNAACTRLLGEQLGHVMENVEIPEEPSDSASSRIAIPHPHGNATIWCDVDVFSTERGAIHYATDVTNAVHAEAAQREFVQTLTKTFANLTTGLAIFDRNKQLALFNPALVDLTALPAEFLSGRPSLMSFFDNLRDRQVMPEPKNYADWRAQINAMIETASDGFYQETWSLPSGVTYRVTGRPHPDGAVAFLFEDITAEISLTRRFRAQNDLRQSVIDKLDHAVAVIAANNVVIFCNATWTDMFGVDPDTSFAELGIRDLVTICAQKYPHPDFWQTVETLVTGPSLAGPVEEVIDTETAGPLHCRLVPVVGGAAIICHPISQPARSVKPEPVAS